MPGRSRFISDMAQMANGAASALGGLREEIDNIVKQRTERSLNARGLVTREEFDALRTRHDAVAARLAALESRLAEQTVKKAPKGAPKKAAKKAVKSAGTSSGTRAKAAKKS
jgi:BMFP domain-containing protein YqiC